MHFAPQDFRPISFRSSNAKSESVPLLTTKRRHQVLRQTSHDTSTKSYRNKKILDEKFDGWPSRCVIMERY